NNSQSGFQIDDAASGTGGCDTIHMSGNTIENNNGSGIDFFGSFQNHTDGYIRNNDIRNNSSDGINIGGVKRSVFIQNRLDSNAQWQITFTDGTLDTFTRNNILPSPTRPDSGFRNTFSGNLTATRNWWGTIDSVAVKAKIGGSARDSIIYIPYRLDVADSASGADTVAPKAPDTVAAQALGAGENRITWAISTTEEDPSGVGFNVSSYRIYSSNAIDSNNWFLRGTVGTTNQMYIDSNVAPGDTKFYRVSSGDNATYVNYSFFSDSQPSAILNHVVVDSATPAGITGQYDTTARGVVDQETGFEFGQGNADTLQLTFTDAGGNDTWIILVPFAADTGGAVRARRINNAEMATSDTSRIRGRIYGDGARFDVTQYDSQGIKRNNAYWTQLGESPVLRYFTSGTALNPNRTAFFWLNPVDSKWYDVRDPDSGITNDVYIRTPDSFSIRVNHFTHFFPGEGLVDTVSIVTHDTTSFDNAARGEPMVTIMALSIFGDTTLGDTITQFEISSAGNVDTNKLQFVQLARDANQNNRFDTGIDTIVASISSVAQTRATWRASAISVTLGGSGESFVVIGDIGAGAANLDTFQAKITAYTIKTFDEETGPSLTFTNSGFITIIDTNGANIWYVNDGSTVGDSFTSAIGDTLNNGLGINSPKRFINQVEPFLTAGDTIYVDSGTYQENDTVTLNGAGIALIGIDSQTSIIDFNDLGAANARSIQVLNSVNVTIRNLRVYRSRNAFTLENADTATISQVTMDSHSNSGVSLQNGSDNVVITDNLITNGNSTGIYVDASFFATIRRNTIRGMGSDQILVVSGDGATLTNNVVTQGASHGITLQAGVGAFEISRNIVTLNGIDGINLNSSNSSNRVFGNLLGNNGRYGVNIGNGASDNLFAQNHFDSNASYAIFFAAGGTLRDTFEKNIFTFAAQNPDSAVFTNIGNPMRYIRNWWSTTDSAQIKNRFFGSGITGITHIPFLLSAPDTNIGADTIAPKAPDTVVAIATDSTKVTITWTNVTLSEESETSIDGGGYRVYRALAADSNFYFLRGATSGGGQSYIDSGLTPGQTFFYRVTTFDTHIPENQSFYSDSQPSATTANGGVILSPGSQNPGPIHRQATFGTDSAVAALSITGAPVDTITFVSVRLIGATAITDVDSVIFYRDGNKNAQFESNQDTLIQYVSVAIVDTWYDPAGGISLNGSDSFLIVVAFEDTASFADTFTVTIPAGGFSLVNAGPVPAAPLNMAGIWTVSAGVDTSIANIWYVNDNATTGDSFTSAVGADYYNGLTIQTPKRNITMVTPFLTPGDTIFIDAGLFDSIVTIAPSETAAIHIDTDYVFVVGKDSLSTIIDPLGSVATTNLNGIYADTVIGLTIRNLAVTGASNGINLYNIDSSLIEGDSASSTGSRGIWLRAGSDNGIIRSNIANLNSSSGIEIDASSNNTVSGNSTASNSLHGIIVISGGTGNTITGNASQLNGQSGITVQSTNGHFITGNTSILNTSHGVQLVTSDANFVINNLLASNSSAGVRLDAGANANRIHQNEIVGNETGVQIVSSATGNTITKNNIRGNSIYNLLNLATTSDTITRNWWGSADTTVIAAKIGDTNNTFTPFRIGIVDTAALADTGAPKAPDTVTATATDSTRIRIDWTDPILTTEETETSVNFLLYRVYRATTADSATWNYRGGSVSGTFTDSGLSQGSSFFYRVTSVDNHTPYENQSFYSDSTPSATTPTASILAAALMPQPGPIHRASTGTDSTIFAITIYGANPDTVASITLSLLGSNIPDSDVDTVALYRDGNRNGLFESAQDTFVANLTAAGSGNFLATNSCTIAGVDSFVFVFAFEDTSFFTDTFTVRLPAGGVVLSNAGSGPGSPINLAGNWTVNAGIDTSIANIWYVNDSATTGDSFTSAVGADYYNGLTIQTPFRTINQVEPFLTAGDTIKVDGGFYYENDTITINQNGVFLIGMDSVNTVIRFDTTGTGGGRAIYATGQTNLVLRDFRVTNGRRGIWWNNVDLSAIERVRSETNGQIGIALLGNSDTNTLTLNASSGNGTYGIYLFSSSSNNTLTSNTSSGNSIDGFYLDASLNNTLTSNTSSGNSGYGILLFSSSNNNTLTSNTCSGNSNSGIALSSSSNNTLTSNTSSGNSSRGIDIASSSNNTLTSNTVDSNASWGFYISGTSVTDTISKNNWRGQPSGPAIDSAAFIDVGLGKFDFKRNWWDTADSGVLRSRINPGSRDSVTYYPFRLGLVDTAPLADTVAPKAPDTVTATAVDSTRIRIDFTNPIVTSEESETTIGFSTHRVYRSNTVDSTNWILRGATTSGMYTDSGLSQGATAFYRVTSVDNHTPTENQSFYSDSIPSATTATASVLAAAAMPIAGPIHRSSVGPTDSTIFAITISGANPDTVASITLALLGSNIPDSDVDTIAMYRDGNRNGIYESNQDTFVANLTAGGSSNFLASNSCTIAGVDSFVFTFAFEDTSFFTDTFTVRLPAGGVVLSNAGTGPGTPINLAGNWTVNAGIDTNGANKWYVNDTSTSGDSFTSREGASYWSGLSSQTPKRHIHEVTPFLTSGDTIMIDAGLYESYSIIVLGVESAVIKIDTDGVFVIGRDSAMTIIDPDGTNSTVGLYGLYADTQTGLTIRNIGFTGAWNGINFYNVDSSVISGDSVLSSGEHGILLQEGSDTNTVTATVSSGNSQHGVMVTTASSNNTITAGKFATNNTGIRLNPNTGNNTVTQNTVTSPSVYGIDLTTSSGNFVASNTVIGSSVDGIILSSSSSNNTLSGNSVVGSIQHGVYLTSSTGNTVINNAVKGNGQHGIYLLSASNNNILGNLISGNTGRGLFLDISSNVVAERNQIDSNANYQFYIDGASVSDTIRKNNILASPTFPDSLAYSGITTAGVQIDVQRNWWGTVDSSILKSRIWGPSRDSIAYVRYRLGFVDTTLYADTVAPARPDTVTATAIDSTRVLVLWTSVQTSEETETSFDLMTYRVWRANSPESSIYILRGTIATPSFTDSGLTQGQTAYYRVTSIDNHVPENQSFYSDSQPSATTATASVATAALMPIAGPIHRAISVNPDSTIFAFSVYGANPDTINAVGVNLLGNMPDSDVDTIAFYRDGNKDGLYQSNQDTFISNLPFVSGVTWRATALSAVLSGADSFVLTFALEDTANFRDTFTVSIPSSEITMSLAGSAPQTMSSPDIWRVSAGVDTSIANIWYVNDSSTTGDSFTAAVGADYYNGLTIQTP
ncbi:MAG: right-handed parallel beta-helix repeat-containing protein, partial [Candidatus Hydrogenedentota bacterium]